MQYKLVYSNRRTLSISVSSGEITVKSPYGVPSHKIDAFVKDHISWINNAIERTRKKAELRPVAKADEIPQLKRDARKYFEAKTKQYSDIMGLKYGRITITSAEKRFGSCNSKGNICYSYRLMLYPEKAREYVVVHELCHLVHMNHSKSFYALLEQYMPDYKERKKLLG